MYCLDYAGRPPSGNQLSFMLHELVGIPVVSFAQFASYPYLFALYSYSGKSFQSYVAATVPMHSDAVFSSDSRMKTLIKKLMFVNK